MYNKYQSNVGYELISSSETTLKKLLPVVDSTYSGQYVIQGSRISASRSNFRARHYDLIKRVLTSLCVAAKFGPDRMLRFLILGYGLSK